MQEHSPIAARDAAAFSATRTGPVVVLTGASSGIGHATALAFARQGARLVLAARNAEALATIAQACERAGAQAIAVPTDVTDPAAMKALSEAAIARFGQVDVWINNVGVGAVGLFDDTPIEAHRRVIEANLLGHMHGAHAVLPHFRARGRGTLINMISLGGWVAAPCATAYSASKFGLRGFSEALRAELSDLPDVHVCEVFPTFVDTPGMAHGANYSGRQLRPPPPVVDPRRVADVLVALARRPRPSTYIGAPAFPGILAHAFAPDLVGRTMMWGMRKAFARAQPAARSDGNLYEPSLGNAIDGGYRVTGAGLHRAMDARLHPAAVVAGLGAAALGAATLAGLWLWRGRRRA